MPLLEVYERTIEREIPIDVPQTCTSADPFGLDHDCLNPAGHQFVAVCSDVVCIHCARVAWQ